MYANWAYWQLYDKVTFDGIAKLITVNDGVTSLDIRADLYSAWVAWASMPNNQQYLYAVRYTGLDAIPGGRTGDSYFLINGWRLILDLRRVAVNGILFSDNYSTAYYDVDMNPQYPATVSALVNVVSTTQNVVTGDVAAVPAAVWAESIDGVDSAADVLNAVQTMASELHRIHGLLSGSPLLVTATSRVSGAISQTIADTAGTVTVARV